ncbi:hypothetical protein [Streptococcus halichoeri]|uniref:hypothetical protein n=1 Tax=Streptococcus halichoeri TaxID=254785 RepID=UPI00135CB36A|nr:hypothetical protein [Streptococcus halichoeri]
MAESFDYVTFAKDFEKHHGRPPTAEELEKANVSVATVITSDNQKVDFRMVDSLDYVEGYKDKSSFGERLKTGLSFVIRNFFRALLILIQTPVYLTLFFFNLIKSAFAVVVMCVVTKGIVGVLLTEFLTWRNINTLLQAPALLRFFAQNFMTNTLEPIYFTEIDIIICIILTLFVALVTTFSKTEA